MEWFLLVTSDQQNGYEVQEFKSQNQAMAAQVRYHSDKSIERYSWVLNQPVGCPGKLNLPAYSDENGIQ